MKLALYVRSIRSARGAERTIATVAAGLAQRGHRVELLLEEAEGVLLEPLAQAGVRVVPLRPVHAAGLPGRLAERGWQVLALARTLPGALRAAGWRAADPLARLAIGDDPPLRALRAHLRRERPDAMLSFLNYPNLTLLLVAALEPGATRYVVNVRNQISQSSRHARSRWNRSVPLLMRALFERADAVVAPSRGVAEDVVACASVARDRVAVVPNPVVRADLGERSRAPAGHPWLADDATPVVLGVGKLKPQKGFDVLLEAFARARAKRPLRLLLLGEGDQRSALEARARELGVAADVALPGYVEDPFPYYRRAALFVLSSRWEGLPNVLIEAMAVGCPVVSTDCPSGPREILEDGAHGALVPVDDPAALAEAILATLAAPPARDRLVAAAARYGFEASLDGYEAVLRPPAGERLADVPRPCARSTAP